jgi:hypothetical protein
MRKERCSWPTSQRIAGGWPIQLPMTTRVWHPQQASSLLQILTSAVHFAGRAATLLSLKPIGPHLTSHYRFRCRSIRGLMRLQICIHG